MDGRIVFKKKPIPLPAEYRPMYQIALIALVLRYCCRSNTAGLLKLHLFSWCLYSEHNMDIMRSYIANDYRTSPPHWTIDPVLNRAINLAIADGFCKIKQNKKYKLTQKGVDMVSELESDNDLLYNEKSFLKDIGCKISDSKVENMKY